MCFMFARNQNGKRCRPKLAVCAIDNSVTQQTHDVDRLNWDIIRCWTLDEILQHIWKEDLDAVALPFDPFDHDSRLKLLRLSATQKSGRPFLISYSTFNPNWIENLVLNSGANLHIRGALDIKDAIRQVEAHAQM